jgi:hypothetical protein
VCLPQGYSQEKDLQILWKEGLHCPKVCHVQIVVFFFTHHCITILPVKEHPILLFILCLPLKGRIGSRKERFRFQEGDIHSHIEPTGRGVIASVALLMHGVAQEKTPKSTLVQFGSLVLMKMHISHTPKYSRREHEGCG